MQLKTQLKSLLKSTYSQLNYINLIIKSTENTEYKQTQRKLKKFIVCQFMCELGELLPTDEDDTDHGDSAKSIVTTPTISDEITCTNTHDPTDKQAPIEELPSTRESTDQQIVDINQQPTDTTKPSKTPVNHRKQQPSKTPVTTKLPPIIEDEINCNMAEHSDNSITSHLDSIDKVIQDRETAKQMQIDRREETYKTYLMYTSNSGKKEYIATRWITEDTGATITPEEINSYQHIAQYTYDMINTKHQHKHKFKVTTPIQLKLMTAIAKYLYRNRKVTCDPVSTVQHIKDNYREFLMTHK